MMDIAQRLASNGLAAFDVRAALPRASWTWATRPLSFIKRIVVHYDGVFAPDQYNEMDRLISEAAYHREKDWGGGARGDGLMYHISISRSGAVRWCRNFEEITWHCGSPNTTSIGVKLDGGEGQIYTQLQANALQALLDILTTKCPEFPASRGDVYGHLEMVQFGGTATKCPDQFLPGVVSYRTGGTVASPYGQLTVMSASVVAPPRVEVPAPMPTLPPTPPAPVNIYRTVRLKSGVEGLRIRATANGTAIGMIYSKGGGYAPQFDVYQQTETAGGYVWLRRKDDNGRVAEIGIDYL